MAEVYPKIKEYCREKHGLEFQVKKTPYHMHPLSLLVQSKTYLYVYLRNFKYCIFQVVDMRWGVRDEATDDHMTTELCMREIINCQRLSMGPNFVVSFCIN